MSNENSPPATPSTRRASFAPGQRLSQLLGLSPGDNATAGTPPYPGPIAAAAANAQASQRRRMSISTLGLSGSPTQTSPFGSFRGRQESISSNGSGSAAVEESAIEDGDAGPNQTPSTPFGRRMSFGARALRDVRAGSGNVNGRPSINSAPSPPNNGRGEGFNWSDQLRSRAQRSSSITSPAIPSTAPNQEHVRAASVAAMEPPVKEIPKASKAPDHFQERILKGDFYMD